MTRLCNDWNGSCDVQPADAPEPEETVPIKKADSKKTSEEVPEAKPADDDSKPKARPPLHLATYINS